MADRYASLKQGLVGCWIPSVSGSGLLLPDLSGYGNNGSLVGMDASDWVSSQYGRALDFDGSNDYVSFKPLTPALGFSFACWFKASNASRARQSLFSNSTDASPDIYLHIESISGTTNAMNFYNGSGYLGASTTFTQDTNLHHYAWTTSSTGVITYYRDGLSLGSPGLIWTPGNDNSSFATIGAIVDLMGPQFTAEGQIDDCRRYSRTLTQSEIRLLASRPGIGLRQESHRNTFYQFPTGNRRRRILTGMP